MRGNFDDAQTGVKKIFANPDYARRAEEEGFFFSSANSINWGRLAPQIVYYISAYCDLVKENEIFEGDVVNVCVPTGNFGNIFAAYLAREMGLPLGKLICASNSNCVLTDFIESGEYDRTREFYKTMSPSMDILVSSNLERLLYVIGGPSLASSCMNELSETRQIQGSLTPCLSRYTKSSRDISAPKPKLPRLSDRPLRTPDISPIRTPR